MGKLTARELADDPLPIYSAAAALLQQIAENAKSADPHRLTACAWLRLELAERAPRVADSHNLTLERFVIVGMTARGREAIALALGVPRAIHDCLTIDQFDLLTEAWEQHRVVTVCSQAAEILTALVADHLVRTDR
jgi:hypothetical protein